MDNKCERLGHETESVGKAIPVDETNAKLKVYFSETFNIAANYWIVKLIDGYSYAVISSPDYRYLWILSREKKTEERKYREIIRELRKDGFPVQFLKRTQQDRENE